ncbi:osmoprotectant transport system permease protein [Homoserinimonas aerilata]|uniref:Osmoprotectant transport system permease protein n=1 Tax=Homoserinimonas aerilata TaxID=1162970 RepID=A0A542YGY9_9MICO|nr:ABC transporter permease subunit [Homoserinimonas aerilata]TQL47326.1 osmoprotectant transport system permease protein [Homoserinimonas aerilata]
MEWTIANFGLIWELTLNHVRLSVIPIVLGLLIAVPLGWLANRNAALRVITISGGSLLFTIPSLPLFVILPYVLGTRVTDETNVIVALTIYAVAVMVRSAADALAAVPVSVLQSASAMGFSPWMRFWSTELPLAGPVLLAGLRVVSVSTIALVSVGALVGSRNLGYLFTNGKQRDFLEEILVGIVATLVIAVVFDVVLVLLGRILMPWQAVVAAQRGVVAVGKAA